MNLEIDAIGIPPLSEEELEQLAEECENEVSTFVFEKVPPKSIEELSVSCVLELSDKLDVEIQIDLDQKYDTGHSLDELVHEATLHGIKWLDQKLMELKGS
jgi:hypothetical protein